MLSIRSCTHLLVIIGLPCTVLNDHVGQEHKPTPARVTSRPGCIRACIACFASPTLSRYVDYGICNQITLILVCLLLLALVAACVRRVRQNVPSLLAVSFPARACSLSLAILMLWGILTCSRCFRCMCHPCCARGAAGSCQEFVRCNLDGSIIVTSQASFKMAKPQDVEILCVSDRPLQPMPGRCTMLQTAVLTITTLPAVLHSGRHPPALLELWRAGVSSAASWIGCNARDLQLTLFLLLG